MFWIERGLSARAEGREKEAPMMRKVRNDGGFDLGFREACEERKIVGFFYRAEVALGYVAEEVDGG